MAVFEPALNSCVLGLLEKCPVLKKALQRQTHGAHHITHGAGDQAGDDGRQVGAAVGLVLTRSACRPRHPVHDGGEPCQGLVRRQWCACRARRVAGRRRWPGLKHAVGLKRLQLVQLSVNGFELVALLRGVLVFKQVYQLGGAARERAHGGGVLRQGEGVGDEMAGKGLVAQGVGRLARAGLQQW